MEVRWTARARRSYERAIAYIEKDSGSAAAEKVGARIIDAGDALGLHPAGRPGRVAGTFEKSLPDVRYILLYRIRRPARPEVVEILDVVHASRNWPRGRLPPR